LQIAVLREVSNMGWAVIYAVVGGLAGILLVIVSSFEEFWTFGRLDDQWKLKEVHPPSRGEAMGGEENLDQDSSPEQLQWYYSKPRAT
jgi:hypothetical protein